ncbi:MAG: hypothetical protein ABL888_21230 [Pirellulaceae bacterium]
MNESVFEAIRNGQWDFEPECVEDQSFEKTQALPGTSEKVDVLAERLLAGLPLWHAKDRLTYDDSEKAWR